MRKSTISLLLFLFIFVSLKAQLNITGQIGIGFYSMKSLEQFQKERLNRMPEVPAQLVSDFPPYINYKALISFPRKGKTAKCRYYYGFQTTGSRISLTDYSGKLIFDQTVNGHMAGVEVGLFTKQISRVINLRGSISFGAIATILQMRDYLEMWEEKYDMGYTYYAYGGDVEPGVLATYNHGNLSIGLSLGYLQDISTTFRFKGYNKSKLNYNGDQRVYANWAGLRTGLELSYTLFTKAKKSENK